MAKLSSKAVEKKVLALLMQAPTHMKALRLDPEAFAFPAHRELATLIKKYVTKHKTIPTKNTLRSFANIDATTPEKIDKLVDAITVLSKLPKVKPAEAIFYFDRLENYHMGRAIYDIGEGLKQKFEAKEEVDFMQIRQELLTDLLIKRGADEFINRGFIYDNVEERWQQYKSVKKGQIGNIVPFGIAPFDKHLGGMYKSFVTLIYSRTGGGKTRTAINIAYNAAIAGYNVMYFSLEMAFDLIANCFDSRMANIDSKEIIFGKLNRKDKKKFKKTLIKQAREKLNIWLVDISMGSKSSVVLEELELYKALRGVFPDLIVVDYANIMEPIKRYMGRSERYDNLFQEFHEIAKYANTALLTLTQESRDASKTDIEKKKQGVKEEDLEGVHNIGLSNFMAPHCESVLRLKQNNQDMLQNRLWAIIDKNRYGTYGIKIPLLAVWAKTYVGDRLVPGTRIRRKK